MAIFAPGRRNRRGRRRGVKKVNAVAVLSLTAMVDLFTVLVVFLLQNYATTGDILYIPNEVVLPNAAAVKESRPANVIVVSHEKLMFNDIYITSFLTVKESQDWMIPGLKNQLLKVIDEGEEKKREFGYKIKSAVSEAKRGIKDLKDDDFRTVTIQADKSIDFLSIKKIMYTAIESGIFQVNFAVIKKEREGEGEGEGS